MTTWGAWGRGGEELCEGGDGREVELGKLVDEEDTEGGEGELADVASFATADGLCGDGEVRRAQRGCSTVGLVLHEDACFVVDAGEGSGGCSGGEQRPWWPGRWPLRVLS